MARAGRLRQRARSWALGWEDLVDISFKVSGDVVRDGDSWQKALFLDGVDALAMDADVGREIGLRPVFCFSKELNTVFHLNASSSRK
jgi:hypothetical protein